MMGYTQAGVTVELKKLGVKTLMIMLERGAQPGKVGLGADVDQRARGTGSLVVTMPTRASVDVKLSYIRLWHVDRTSSNYASICRSDGHSFSPLSS